MAKRKRRLTKTFKSWAIRKRNNPRKTFPGNEEPPHLLTNRFFHTRQRCQDYIEEQWGYIRHRPDLQEQPHGWVVPRPVRVTITVTEVR